MPQPRKKKPAKKAAAKGKYRWSSDKKLHSRKQLSPYDRDPLYDPRKQLAGRDLRKAATGLAELETAPERQALEREQLMQTTQGNALASRAAGYYKQLAQQEQGRVQNIANIGQRYEQGTANQANDLQARLAAIQSQSVQAMGNDVVSRGGGLQGDAAAGVIQESAAQKGVAANQQAQAAYQASAQNANYGGLANLAAQSRGMAGGELQRQLALQQANQRNVTQSKLTDVASRQGGLRTKYLTDLRQQGYENIVTQAGLGIKQSELQLQGQKERNDARLASAEDQERRATEPCSVSRPSAGGRTSRVPGS